MTTVDRIAPAHGAPCWVSLATHGLAGARDFYGAVLGWTFRRASLGEEFAVALTDGVPVAGIGEVAGRLRMPVSWTPFFSVDEADAIAGRVAERCGTVAVGPLKLGEGRTAVAADPDGARFGFWEGHVLANWHAEGGSPPARLDLRTRDAFAAAIFYGQLFDWAAEDGPCEVEYADETVRVRVGKHTVATLNGGAVESAPDPRVRPRWEVSFPVADVAGTVAAALDHGGSRAEERPDGAAVLCDPEGAFFTVRPWEQHEQHATGH
ncbi:VOC family protein [Streptomyces sp. ODS28]|uniref:VOC family protein n=1 Tax=Streptomyces sp. ODS28 TaxID=3136688 RepID=UPI0031F079FB